MNSRTIYSVREWHEEDTMRGIKTLIIGAVLAVSVYVGVGTFVPGSANVSAADCASNSIMKCGASNLSEFRSKYKANAPGDLDNIYNHYGLTSSVINGGSVKMGKVYRDGRLIVDGKVVGTDARSLGRNYLSGSSSLKIGSGTYYERSTKVSMISYSVLDVFVFYNSSGKIISSIMLDCGNPVTVKPVATPVYKCDSLTAKQIDRVTYDYSVAYTAKDGATLKNFTINFGDGTSKTGLTTNPTRHAYKTPGNYTATATVYFNVSGAVKSVNCTYKVTVAQPPIVSKPSVKIEKTVNGKENEVVKVGEPFAYEIMVTNTGNVKLTDAVVSDAAPANVTFKSADIGTIANNKWTAKVTLAPGESKTFTITATLDKYVATQPIVNKACVDATEVTGNPDDCDTADITTPKEDEIVVCVIADKTIKTIKKSEFDAATMTTDQSKCEDTPAPVTELPKTGMGQLLGGGLGIGSVAGAAYYYRDSRRRLLDTLNR